MSQIYHPHHPPNHGQREPGQGVLQVVVRQVRAEAQRLSRQAVDRTIDAAVAFADVLTPEQWAELVAHWRER